MVTSLCSKHKWNKDVSDPSRRQDFFRKFQPGLAHFFLASGETGQEEFVKRKQKQTLFRNFI